ncbi:MAG TPA: SCP2 sterol-binding domain-containing protein [Anaerolineaceae bacterium]|nr:SCP2 sterol-binding domain-containing protein [Anaerolineaceae bacterium]
MPTYTMDQIMEKLSGRLMLQQAAGLNATILLTVKQAGTIKSEWVIVIKDQTSDVKKIEGAVEKPANPDLTFSGEDQDLVAVFSGQLDPVRAFMMGKFTMKGNMALAMRLPMLFKTTD